MEPFIKHTGLVAPIDRVNVDTDQMVPKQFLKFLTREGYGRVLFYDWRYLPGEKLNPDFVLNQPRYKGASVCLARANFGCGSSREHAPWAILQYGFHAILAPSYADIFYNNCFKNGILPVTLSNEQIDELFKRTEKNVRFVDDHRSTSARLTSGRPTTHFRRRESSPSPNFLSHPFPRAIWSSLEGVPSPCSVLCLVAPRSCSIGGR